jgi:hypothetical protein
MNFHKEYLAWIQPQMQSGRATRDRLHL